MTDVHDRRRDSACELGGVAFERRGTGEPLLLIHGTGSSRLTWRPVTESLSRARNLVLVDLPGHGRSPSLPASAHHSPRDYAHQLAGFLDALGMDRVDVCGHSSGGWTALELAKLGCARSVVAIAPAGLWQQHERWSRVLQLSAQYTILRTLGPLTPQLMRHRKIRCRFLRGAMAYPERVSAADAVEMTGAFAAAAGLIRHVRDTRRERFAGGQDLDVPVTVAWCEKDATRPPCTRLRGELPATTRFVTLSGCGHLAMWDDPRLVAETIHAAIAAEPGRGLPVPGPDRVAAAPVLPRRDPPATEV